MTGDDEAVALTTAVPGDEARAEVGRRAAELTRLIKDPQADVEEEGDVEARRPRDKKEKCLKRAMESPF